MKKFYGIALSLFCAAFLSACADNKGYVVEGTADGTVDGDTVYICDMQGFFSMVPTDTAVVKDGKFEFSGVVENPVLRYLVPTHNGGNANLGMAMFILENEKINIQLFKSDSEKQPIVTTDGPENKLWKEYQALEDTWNKKMDPSWSIVRDQKGTAEEIAAAQKEMDEIKDQMQKAEKEFMYNNLPSAVSDMILISMYSNSEDEAEKAEMLAKFKEKSPNSPNYKKIIAEIQGKKNGEVGAQYTDFSMPDQNGKTISISDYVSKNKYTLVDFWASWCGPCCGEMPNVVDAYSKYHSKGLEIIGVSLDNNKDAWLKGIERLKMTWPQMSDIKGWDCAGAALYGIQAIPANVLIDQSGKIVAKNLREQELQDKLAELLK